MKLIKLEDLQRIHKPHLMSFSIRVILAIALVLSLCVTITPGHIKRFERNCYLKNKRHIGNKVYISNTVLFLNKYTTVIVLLSNDTSNDSSFNF